MEQSNQLKCSIQLKSHLMASDKYNCTCCSTAHCYLHVSSCNTVQNVCARTVVPSESDLLTLVKKHHQLLAKVQDFLN